MSPKAVAIGMIATAAVEFLLSDVLITAYAKAHESSLSLRMSARLRSLVESGIITIDVNGYSTTSGEPSESELIVDLMGGYGRPTQELVAEMRWIFALQAASLAAFGVLLLASPHLRTTHEPSNT